jgi:NAD dependent epimerase/dehydratase family enzyme
MTILITGATGLIGRALTQSLLDHGIRPRVVTRRPHRALEMFDSRVTAFEWHPRTEPLPVAALEGVERVVHLMGEPLYGPQTREQRERIVASRRIGAKRLVDALGRQRVHLISVSSVSVYGYGEGQPLSETTPVQRPKNRMALALISCEEGADQLRENGSTVTHVRMGPVIAPGTFADPLKKLFDRRLTWRNAHAEAAVPAIDQVDAVAMLLWLATTRPLPGPVHAVAPQPLLSADLERVLSQDSPARRRVGLPLWLLRRHIGVLADFVHSRQRIIPQRAINAGFVFSRPDPLESARAMLARDTQQQPDAPGALLGAATRRS